MPKLPTSGQLDKIESYIYWKLPADWTEGRAIRYSLKLGKEIRQHIEAEIQYEDDRTHDGLNTMPRKGDTQ